MTYCVRYIGARSKHGAGVRRARGGGRARSLPARGGGGGARRAHPLRQQQPAAGAGRPAAGGRRLPGNVYRTLGGGGGTKYCE